MGRLGIDDVEDLTGLRLDIADRLELLQTQTECTFIFAGPNGGWPNGVIMSFLFDGETFWVTAVYGRPHADALLVDKRASIVVSSYGTDLPGRRMVAFECEATLHDDQETKDRVLAMIAGRLAPGNPGEFVRLLNSPKRVIMEVKPLKVTASHDSRKMPGDGRGGPAKPKSE